MGNVLSETEFNNQIYIPLRLQEEMARFIVQDHPDYFRDGGTEDNPLVLKAIFVLEDPRDFDAFAEVANSILPEDWNVYDTSGAFGPIINAMDEMLWIAQLIFGGAVITTITILSLLITLFLRERKYEIGIYLALGERKIKVIAQIIIEVLSISMIAMSIALFVGSALSSGVSSQMLEQELMG